MEVNGYRCGGLCPRLVGCKEQTGKGTVEIRTDLNKWKDTKKRRLVIR
jgi:hypothetical protein